MNGLLKVLIGAACVCVIAASGWYLYSERQAYLAEKRADEIKAIATQKRIDYLKAQVQVEIDKAKKIEEQRREEAEAALEAECTTRVPSQSTDNLKALYKQCLTDNAGLYGVKLPTQ